MDVITDALRQMRLSGAVLFRIDCGAPWAVMTAGDLQLPEATHATVFHVVVDGECWVGMPGGPRTRLGAGDAVILPRAEAHYLGDAPDHAPVPVRELLGDRELSQLHDIRWGGDGVRTRILCGFLGYQRDRFTPLYDALPPMFRVSLVGNQGAAGLAPLLRYAEEEIVSAREGSAALRLRMSELLFVEALRRHMEALPEGEHGWLAAVRDPLVGRALLRLHQAPGRDWTVTALAHEIASSRSVLAARFQTLLGEPPMHYLARWRMQQAARMLREGRDSIEAIGEAVGYASPAAFQRAFKRGMGTTPARWRRGGD